MGFIAVILIIFVGDLWIKKYIDENKEFNKEEKILNGNIIITKYHNSGAMLNLLQERKNIVTFVSSVLLGVLLVVFGWVLSRKGDTILKLGLSLLLGGACSNVYERIRKGYVVDYFYFKKLRKIIFNLSDIFIFLGSILIMVYSILKKD